ncbi:hypothetical protein MMC06_002425 [Schaereria dolodes]|nr:hypothetical protein [Schaereria dolodes]
MFPTTSILLLGAAASSLLQHTHAQAIVFPYNCASTIPVCQNDCIAAVEDICSSAVADLSGSLNSTVGGCTAKYVPYNNVPDSKTTCQNSFQEILATASPAANACDGETLPKIGGVIGWDINNQFVKGTHYAIFPVVNNPNCVVHPHQVGAPVPQQYSINGSIYSPASCEAQAGEPITSSETINTRDISCNTGTTAAAICGSHCILAVVAT